MSVVVSKVMTKEAIRADIEAVVLKSAKLNWPMCRKSQKCTSCVNRVAVHYSYCYFIVQYILPLLLPYYTNLYCMHI